MARHAGFGAVATITEDATNALIASSWANLVPSTLYLQLPQTVNLGFSSVSFAGLLRIRPPTVELHANPKNLVKTHFVFRSTFMGGIAGQPLKKWTVELRSTVDVALITRVQGQQIVLGIDTTQVQLEPFQVQVLQGPALPAGIVNALQSTTLATAATALVNSLPSLTVTPPMLTSHLSFSQSLHSGAAWWDNWFTVDVSVSRIVVKPLEKALTVALDFAGFTQGNEIGLVDLTKVKGVGSIYGYTITQPGSDPSQDDTYYSDDDYYETTPYGPGNVTHNLSLSQYPEPGGGDIAGTLNLDFLSAVVANQISPQIEWPSAKASYGDDTSGSPIKGDVDLQSVSLSYDTFETSFGTVQDGLRIDFSALVKEGPWFDVTGRIYAQVYDQGASGSTEFVAGIPIGWRIHIGQVEIDQPWWADFAVAVATIWLGGAIPIIAPAAIVTGGALLSDVIPTSLANAETATQLSLEDGTSDVYFPGDPAYVAFTPEGIDTAGFLPTAQDQPEPKPAPPMLAVDYPSTVYQARDGAPFSAKLVQLGDDFAEFADKITLWWHVRRGDDPNHVLLSAEKTYDDPAGNGIEWKWQLPDQYYVDKFIVECRVYLTLGSQSGEIVKLTTEVPLLDKLDRSRKYVEWGPYLVSFPSPDQDTWFRHRKSRIHRTALGTRCKMLRDRDKFKTPRWHADRDLIYRDVLPFEWKDLNKHRKPLCEYCFFGGPERMDPYPEDDAVASA
jgi:hypothetical protein